MAFQFARIELYSRKGKSGRSTAFVLDEVSRVPSASMHVRDPGAPILVYGLSPDALRALHDERAASARQEVKGGKSRAIRQDQNTLATLVLSHPVTMEEYRASEDIRRDVGEWQARSVKWIRDQYGDRLVSVIRHEDESHPHLHAYILPDDPSMKAAPLHPGFRAKAAVTSAGPQPGEDDKAHAKRANAAYQAAMRDWLNDYHLKVGQRSGLLRHGPGKRHLTRAAWQQEKRQAAALKDTLAKAAALRAKGEAFTLKIRDEAASIRADAARKADAAKAAVVAAQAVERRANRATETARREQEAAQRAMTAARRLAGFGGALRGLWDGLRRSRIAARIRDELMPTVEQWQKTAETAAKQAADADRRRREVEKTAKELRRSAAELGAQRDELRERLAQYEPATPAFAPAAPRPHP